MAQRSSALEVYFYATNSGNEPVREWLKDLSKEDKITYLVMAYDKDTYVSEGEFKINAKVG